MELIQEIIIFGTIKGCVYALIATGFTLIFAVAGILNLAHGTFYMLGAYFTYTLFYALGHTSAAGHSAGRGDGWEPWACSWTGSS